MQPDDIGSMAFPFSHIAGPDYLFMMLAAGFPAVLIEAFVPAQAVEVFIRHGVTMIGGGTAFYSMFLAEQRKTPEQKRFIPTLRQISGGGAPKPPELYWAVQQRGRRTALSRVRHDRGADDRAGLAARHRRPARAHRGRTGRGASRCASSRPTARSPLRARKARCACAGRSCARATPTRGDGGGFDDEGWFRTGDLGVLPRRRARRADRAAQGRHHPQGREHLREGARRPAVRPPQGRRRRRHRVARPGARRAGLRGRRGPREGPTRRPSRSRRWSATCARPGS